MKPKNKKLFLLIGILLFLFGILFYNTHLKQYNKEETQVVENIKEMVNIPEKSIDDITLKPFSGFYQGEYPEKDITSITFTCESPPSYDEKWFANVSNTEYITGYRVGTQVFIVGEDIKFNPSSKFMFAGFTWESLEEINGLNYISTERVRDFESMFHGLTNVKFLDVGNWNLKKADNTSFMFAFCTSLENIDVENWDVSNVSTFEGMFQGNSNKGDMSLKEINVSKWNTSSATNMGHLFYGCGLLENIDISNWNVEKVRNFSHMFADCYNLKTLDFSKWETLSVKSFDALLNDCRSLTTIDVSGLDTETCEQFSQMFESCINLEEIKGLETWDTSNASKYAFSEMFHCCKKLKNINVSNFNTIKADNMARMFCNCENLTFIDISNFDTENVLYVTEMFYNTPKLKEIIGLENIILENIPNKNNFR